MSIEITYENLKKIQRIDKELGAKMTFAHLLDIFGNALWDWTETVNEKFTIKLNSENNNNGCYTIEFDTMNLEMNLAKNLEKIQNELIKMAMQKTNSVQKDAAKILGITPGKLCRILKKNGNGY